MIENLEELLSELNPNDISRFSLAGAETLWLTFRNTYTNEFKGDVNITADLFDKAWLLVSGQLKDTTVEQLETTAKEQIPDLDNFMDIFESAWRTTLASATQNAATGVWLAICGLATEPIGSAMDTADIIANTLDILISTQYSVEHGNDEYPSEEDVTGHPLYQHEKTRQLEAIQALKNGKAATFRAEFVTLMNLETLGIPPQ
ncbi:DUF416 family protein [Chitinophaga filiformis]|uniref:Uncharacterized protein n=1 Tax=Chitinophaga filiformis TaxID=104663 RepID=A0A1G7MP52_CHIFI|nr:DUF416 family protein [Chitinophaga filiformis]SDF62900.1 Protein of unknown function [Chitinophaga filiformis]